MTEEYEELSCDINKFREQIAKKARIAVVFAGKEFPATEPFIEALAEADAKGFLGNMELGVISVDNEQCDRLADSEKVELLPSVCVYSKGKRVGCVTPSDEDAKVGYHKTIEKLIDLSED